MTFGGKSRKPALVRCLGLAGAVLLLGAAGPQTPSVSGQSQVTVGEYLVAIGGCNDCHTVGWNQNPGKVPNAQRLTGNPVGWHGPWGTSYAVNLRLLAQRLTADAWVQYIASMQPRPPMPWFNMRAMSESDLRAIYAYIRSLGPGGAPTPDDLAPGETPTAPYLEGVPIRPPKR
jgi:mono/diheme cytochrome c family protein